MENHSPVVTCLSTLLRGNAQAETSSYTRKLRKVKTAADRTHPANLLQRGRTYLPSETTIILTRRTSLLLSLSGFLSCLRSFSSQNKSVKMLT
ncbi:hypothetical protein ILYODFUR_026515 [Ilyodon furcidens]|uniref:Uncharacterized protein n=1 Tax=Ilyodon furcidens TaxID=33524 RepID=A0ABV0TBA0_9TELE